MKQLFLPVAALLIFTVAQAQDCKNSLTSYTKGAVFTMTHYDAQNVEKSKNTSTVTDVKTTAGGKIITLHTTSSDGNDKKAESDISLDCEGSTLKLDFAGAITNANSMAGRGNMEMKFDKTHMEFPINAKPGQTLPDDKMVMTVLDKNSGTSMGASTFNFKNRKVVGKESITTPAGTFDCYKITTDVSMEMNMMGRAMPGRTMKSESYYSSSVGMVKSVIYDDKGNVSSSTVLTKVSK